MSKLILDLANAAKAQNNIAEKEWNLYQSKRDEVTELIDHWIKVGKIFEKLEFFMMYGSEEYVYTNINTDNLLAIKEAFEIMGEVNLSYKDEYKLYFDAIQNRINVKLNLTKYPNLNKTLFINVSEKERQIKELENRIEEIKQEILSMQNQRHSDSRCLNISK